jgi:hypothetical protein
MFRAFQLSGLADLSEPVPDFYLSASEREEEAASAVLKDLRELLRPGGEVDASRIQSLWFPQVKADVFISHSHKDRTQALNLAGFLHKKFGIRTFVDSSVWRMGDELLREIDNTFCRNDDGATYSYEKRNGTTAHVHMMLTAALSKMLDRAECVIFLNTPNSITPRASSRDTNSCWIYLELALIDALQTHEPERPFAKSLVEGALSRGLEKRADFKPFYPVSMSRLRALAVGDVFEWARAWTEIVRQSENTRIHPLDVLYWLTGAR